MRAPAPSTNSLSTLPAQNLYTRSQRCTECVTVAASALVVNSEYRVARSALLDTGAYESVEFLTHFGIAALHRREVELVLLCRRAACTDPEAIVRIQFSSIGTLNVCRAGRAAAYADSVDGPANFRYQHS